MKKYIFIFFVLFYANIALAHSHYPITRDSLEAIKNGKILYNQYCASCHQPNLAGAANWQGLDKDGHRKAPPLTGLVTLGIIQMNYYIEIGRAHV